MLNVHPILYSWRGQFANACRNEAALLEAFGRVTVINSDDAHTRPGWIDLGAEAFAGAHFERALEVFDGDALFQLQADASYHDWPAVLRDAQASFQQYGWGIYAPHVDYTPYTAAETDVPNLGSRHPHLRMVGCTDSICWFVHRDIVQAFKAQGVDVGRNKFGWGFDLVLAAVSFQSRRAVMRDYSHVVQHPQGTGYDRVAADAGMREMMRGLDLALLDIIMRARRTELRPTLAQFFV